MSTSIAFDIIAHDRASKTFSNVGQAADKSTGRLKTFAKVGAASLAAVGAAAVAAGTYAFNYGAKLEQMGMKAETVFGSQLGSVQDWADKSAHAMGLTTREATGLAANFADLLIPMGFTRKAAADMATDVVGLSGALSQWSGGTKSAAEVTEILNAAMLGETDGLKSLGIAISAADIEARLLKKGQDDLTGAAQQQAEALAIQELIFEKSTDAQKAFAEGGSPLLSAQGKLKAMFGEVRDELIVGLMPMMVKFADFMVNDVVPAAKKLGDWIKVNLVPALKDIGSWVGKNVLPVLQAFGGFIMDHLVPAMRDALGGALKGVRGFLDNLGDSLKDNRPFLEAMGTAVKEVAGFLLDKLGPALGWIYENVLPLLGEAIGTAITVVKKITSALLKMGEWGVRAFSFLLDAAFAAFEGILAAAEKGLGWVPKLGDKIRNARDSFSDFRDRTVGSLERVADKLGQVHDKINGIPSTKNVDINVRLKWSNITPSLPGVDVMPDGPILPRSGDGGGGSDRPSSSPRLSSSRTASGGSDYRMMVDAFIEALRQAPVVQLSDAGQGAFMQGVRI